MPSNIAAGGVLLSVFLSFVLAVATMLRFNRSPQHRRSSAYNARHVRDSIKAGGEPITRTNSVFRLARSKSSIERQAMLSGHAVTGNRAGR